ncbi:MAG TPA: xanthine dehydrogenase family protein subunit M [Aliidongia sp.]|uniref:FAD binding domain-containing protein n=1 Tax=Aliidongia sp. TaxID=1914230 RepID=UPI002DDCEFD5|nr:xanthine dehydrogenase family protein subunit M [Aliidongia sp.]HEV2673257.1 xanthine dehydrogenase family protein subunit M [Aliidongia sp.]
MQPFTLEQGRGITDTIARGRAPGADYIAGGTDLMQLLKDDVRRPSALIDLEGLDLGGILVTAQGLRLGAMARMGEVADHPAVLRDYPVISEALLASAAPQIRNLGTIGGNLLQRTRCTYFRDTASPCNKRAPGTGCAAIEGNHRTHAIFGGSRHCIATHASDLAVALAALDATVHLHGPNGERDLKVTELHLVPSDHPDIETMLHPGELILAVTVPAGAWTRRSHYLKVRDRASFEFALTSAAVALDIQGGTIRAARVAAGGVGTKPWRLPAVEQALVGAPATADTWARAGQLSTAEASPLTENRFKVRLLQNTVACALEQAGGQT